jgi:phosphatidylglycerophosphatase A
LNEGERRRAPRFPAGLILRSPVHLPAFGFGTGLAPVAPGTFGTLPGVLLFVLISPLPLVAFGIALLAITLYGIWVCGASSRLLGVHDHPGIVWDEIVGYCIAAAPLLPALGWFQTPMWLGLLVAFVWFRIFDILKPWPIRQLDADMEGGLGIMVDDLLAGLYAAAATLGTMELIALLR